MLAHSRSPTSDAPLVIVADDLTGALDAAAPFAALPVAVATRPDGLADALATGASVVAVSTRTREADDAAAFAAVAAVRAALPGRAVLFKKIDSRLKGPIAAELAALGVDEALVLPAVPELGRTVSGGALGGFGVSAPIPVRPRLGLIAATIPDTATDGDIDAALATAAPGAVVVGARGATAALARRFGLAPAAPPPLAPPVAAVIGSRDPITAVQIDRLRAANPAGLILLTSPLAEAEPAAVAAALCADLRPHLGAVASLILSGGATAEAVLDALGIALLRVEGELLPGVPVSRAGELRIVTKSGGFGAPDALLALVAATAAAGAP